MIRSIVQPSPKVPAPEERRGVTLPVSLVSGACPHMIYISAEVAEADSGAVVVEVSSPNGDWVGIKPRGVTAVPKALGISAPNRDDGIYRCAQTLYTVRLRAKPGYTCDTLYASIVLPTTATAGAYVSGCAGFKATLSGGDPNICTVSLTPGGSCGQVRGTDFTKFSGEMYAYVYTEKPDNKSAEVPPPQLITETVALSHVAPLARGLYRAQLTLPDDLTTVYILPFVRWASSDCSRCVNTGFAHPTADNYPLILRTEAS